MLALIQRLHALPFTRSHRFCHATSQKGLREMLRPSGPDQVRMRLGGAQCRLKLSTCPGDPAFRIGPISEIEGHFAIKAERRQLSRTPVYAYLFVEDQECPLHL
jgi:hypothetical protein